MNPSETRKPVPVDKMIFEFASTLEERHDCLIARETDDADEFNRTEALPRFHPDYNFLRVDALGSLYLASYRNVNERPPSEKIISDNATRARRYALKRWTPYYGGIESVIRAASYTLSNYDPAERTSETSQMARISWFIARLLVRLRPDRNQEVDIDQARAALTEIFEETRFTSAVDPIKQEIVQKTMEALQNETHPLIRRSKLAAALYRGAARKAVSEKVLVKYSNLMGVLMDERDMQRSRISEAQRLIQKQLQSFSSFPDNPKERGYTLGRAIAHIDSVCQHNLTGSHLTVRPYRNALLAKYLWLNDSIFKGYEKTPDNPEWQFYLSLRNSPDGQIKGQEFDFTDENYSSAISIYRNRSIGIEDKMNRVKLRLEAMLAILQECMLRGDNGLLESDPQNE